MDLPKLLEIMVAGRASDLHLSALQTPRMRVDGEIVRIGSCPGPEPSALSTFFATIAPRANLEAFEATGDTDFAYSSPLGLRFRVNLFMDLHGPGAVFRHIEDQIPSVEKLGLPEVVIELADLSRGLVLVTGPTGSGKSTTLAALLHRINERRTSHILTIEDPIEFVHASKNCIVNQREVGPHTRSFKAALRAGLREDPDVVLVGELRDQETIAIALETAETGHLVFGTLHTTTAITTVERVIEQFPGDQQSEIRMILAECLRAVVAQTLVSRLGGGRVAAFEVLLGNAAVSNLIREGKTHQLISVLQTGRGAGMRSQNDALLELVKEGVVDPEEALAKAVDRTALQTMLRQISNLGAVRQLRSA